MEYSIYIDKALKLAYASLTAKSQPHTPGVLQSHLLFRCYFFDSTDETPAAALLDEAATFRVGLKPASNPTADALIYRSTVSETGADYYDFEWDAIDSAALRTLLGKSESVECNAEIAWTIDGVVERVSWPMCVRNANLRTTDGPPNPTDDASSIFVGGIAVCYDRVQALTPAQRRQALANLGLTFVHGALRFDVLDNGDIDHIPLDSGAPSPP